jgi:hypothetical protein
MPKLIVHKINPIKFYPINPVNLPQYLSRHYDDFPYVDTIQPWETFRIYVQPWQTSDNIRLQIEADYGPHLIELIDQDERLWYSQNFQQVLSSSGGDGYIIYECDIPLNIYPPGVYYLKIGNFLISEPLKILVKHKNTVLLEYQHHLYKGDVVFGTGFFPQVRVRGTVRLESPSSKDTLFEDQNASLRLEDSKSYDVSKFLIGGPSGIPNWYATKLRSILGCSTLKIDGRLYTRDGKMEPLTAENYPLKSYSVDLREVINRESHVYENEEVQIGATSMIVIVDGEAFSMNSGSGAEQQIITIG